MVQEQEPAVLFVDDDEQVVDFLSTFCRALGVEHASTTSAHEALQMCATRRFDLVITDLKMPTMDGVELAKRLKKEHPDIGLFSFTGETGHYNLDELKEIFEYIYFKPTDYSRMIGETMKFLALRKYPGLR